MGIKPLAAAITVGMAAGFAQAANAAPSERPGSSNVFATVIEHDEFTASGWVEVEDLLRELSMTGVDANGDISLKSFDARHTLVLLDGQRLPRGLNGEPILDGIPIHALERIEIGSGGAGRGSAIAGVINLVTANPHHGVIASHQVGQFASEGESTTSTAVSFGRIQERYQLQFHANHVSEDSVSRGDRLITAEPVSGTGTAFGSDATPQGRFGFPSSGFVELTIPVGTNVDGPEDFVPGSFALAPDSDRYNFAPEMSLTPERTVTSLLGQLAFEGENGLKGQVDTLFRRASEEHQLAAPFLYLGLLSSGAFLNVGISADSAFNVFGEDFGPYSYQLARRLTEAGPRRVEQESDGYRLTASLTRDIPHDNPKAALTWTIDAGWDHQDHIITQTRQIDATRLARALSGAPCATNAFGDGCVELNLFGGQGVDGQGTITASMLDYIMFDAVDHGDIELGWVGGAIDGQFDGIGSRPVAWSGGVSLRRESGYLAPDPHLASFDQRLVKPGTDGGITTREFYLVAETDLADTLHASAGGRIADFSEIDDNAYAGHVSLHWRPTNNWSLDARWLRDYAAPSIEHLFGAQRFGNVTGPYDPCNSIDSDGDGIPDSTPDLPGCVGVWDFYTQSDPHVGLRGAADTAQAETSRTWSIGAGYRMEWAGELTVRTRVTDTEIADRLSILDGQALVNACAYLLRHCDKVARPFVRLNGYDLTWLNDGSLQSQVVDFGLNWLHADGRLGVAFNATYQTDLREEVPIYAAEPGAPNLNQLYQSEGLITLNRGRLVPRWRASLDAYWTGGRWAAGWATRFVGSSREPCGVFPEFGQCNDDFEGLLWGARKIGSTTYHDLRVSYDWQDWQLTLGVRNIFDKGPPLSTTESGSYYTDEYRVPGRFPYLRLGVRL